jgi:nucleoid-associated protein YgaU
VNDQTRLKAVADMPNARRSTRPASRSLGRTARAQRRRRRVAGLVRFAVFLLLIFVAVWAGVRVAHAGDDATIYTGTSYTVQAGDDLWTIAGVQYGPHADPRAAVFAIREANGLRTSALRPGQELTLPYLEE